MQSDIGALLTKIAAIINFAVAGIVLLLGVIAFLGVSFYQGTPLNLMIVLVIVFLVLIVLGILLLNASKKMKNPSTVKNGAIWAIVLGVLTFSNFSGVLAIIGGVIALIDSDK